jgi:hypothetical protein
MKKSIFLSVLTSAVLLASAVNCGGAIPGQATPGPEAPAGVVRARDAAVTYVQVHFDDAPPESASWSGQRVTPQDIVGGSEWRYTSGNWVVTVSYAVTAPESMVYYVRVVDTDTGFEWDGRVDASGQVPEAPEATLLARDAALLYVSEHYDQSGLGVGLAWEEERLTPENVVGAETYQYTAGDWVVTISYPVVLPEETVYSVSIVNTTTGFEWEGEVDAAGTVTELSVSQPPG